MINRYKKSISDADGKEVEKLFCRLFLFPDKFDQVKNLCEKQEGYA